MGATARRAAVAGEAAAAMAEVAGASIWEGAWTVGLMRPPRLKLRLPRLSLPGPMACFALSFALYFIVISGSVHNVILEPPSMGQMLDPASQKPKPVVFVEGRINGQYIIEGLSAGFFCALGGAGLIMIDLAQDTTMARMNRTTILLGGVLFCFIAYNLVTMFMRFKMPNYLLGSSL